MDLEGFCLALSKTSGWELAPSGAIRNGKHCPLSYLGGGNPCAITIPKDALGIGYPLALDIVDAADNWRDHDPSVRHKLLESTGLL